MLIFLFVFHILIMLTLIGVILLQPSKGDDYGGSQMFSARGVKGGFIMILTTVLGAMFFLNSIFMAKVIASEAVLTRKSTSIKADVKAAAPSLTSSSAALPMRTSVAPKNSTSRPLALSDRR